MPLYLKVTPEKGPVIDGDVTTSGYEKQIDVKSMGWDVANPVAGVPSTGAAISVSGSQVSTFSLVKRPDSASPKLFLACAKGEHLKSVVLTITSADATKKVLYTYTLENAMLSLMRSTIDAVTNELTESLTLKYAKITVKYATAAGPVEETFDSKAIA